MTPDASTIRQWIAAFDRQRGLILRNPCLGPRCKRRALEAYAARIRQLEALLPISTTSVRESPCPRPARR